MKRRFKWAAALVVSGVLHAGAAAFLLRETPGEVQIYGSAAIELAVLGSFEDAFQAGDPVEPLETVTPAEEPVDTAEPVTAPETAAEVPQTAQPVEIQRAERAENSPAAMAARAPAAVPAFSEPVESEPTLPVQVTVPAPPLPSEHAREPAETRIAAAVATDGTPQEAPVQAAEVVQTALAAVEPLAQTVEPVGSEDIVEAVEEFPIPEEVPLPTARPEPPVVREAVVRPDRAKTETRRQQEKTEHKAERKPVPRSSGDGGQQKRSTTRGQATGNDRGKAAASGTGSRSSQAGNATVSNYPGKVASKLRRAVRAVPRSARRGAQRDVHVSFVVTASGGLGSARITQSSGSAELDRAALAAVRKAAPFPPIPAGAGRNTWQFSVPLGLAR